MSDQSQGPGWWQASDAKWYPPETHPSRVQPPPAPPTVPPAVVDAPVSSPRPDQVGGFRGWKLWGSLGVVALVALGVAVLVIGSDADEDAADSAVATQAVEDSGNGSEDPTNDVPSLDTGEEADEPVAEETEPDPAGSQGGTRDTPWAFGIPTAVTFETFGDADGSVWNVTIGAPEDVTATVSAANDFNDPPPDGVVFMGFPVSMTLIEAGKVPLSPGFNFVWELLGGSTATVYDAWTMDDVLGCGVLPAELNGFSEVFVGGTLTGTVCVPLPAEDVGHPMTQVALNFSGSNRVIFAADGVTGTEAGPAEIDDSVATGTGSGDRQAPYSYDTATSVTFESFGDADGSVWDVVVGAPQDITAQVLAENTFNDPPPDGVVFVGFSVDITLLAADKVPLSPGFNFNWELLGGATHAVYTYGTIGGGFGCGVIPGAFEAYSEVFVGGSLTGTVCLLLPTEDLGLATTQVALNFADGNRAVFGQ